MTKQPVGDGDAVDDRRLELIDAESGGRFHHAMRDQISRAHTFERLLRWQRMRHDLMVPIELPEAEALALPGRARRSGADIDLRDDVSAIVELPAPRPSAAC